MSPTNGKIRNHIIPNVQSLDEAMMQEEQEATSVGGGQNNKDSQSVVESYKRRSNSYFANPLMPPKELFVPVP